MSNSIAASTGAVPDPAYGAQQRPAAEAATPAAGPTPAASEPDPADLRLIIEEDQKAGCFVYKTVDRRSGKVVQQWPREQILKLREADSYVAGAVIKAQV
jgi:flagellar protein FlaG